jgi:RimJ/RimL family protein N-acetyltransferase
MSDAAAAEFLAHMAAVTIPAPGEWVQLAIAEPSGVRLVGDIGIFLAADETYAEIGFTLAPEAQGRGIATGAVRETVRLVFASTQVLRVLAVTDSRNEPSMRLLERAGFRRLESREAVFREEKCIEHVYGLSRHEAQGVQSADSPVRHST